MAGYGRYRYGRYSRRRYGWSKSRSSRRRALGNARAGRQQRDAATVTISRIATVSISVPAAGSSPSGEPPGYGTNPDSYWNVATINHWNQLRQSTYFTNYSPMYDQMKIDKIRMKVTGSQSGTSITPNISPAVVLAFDRNGLDSSQIASSTSFPLSTASISTYSSAQMKQWSTGNAFAMYQTIYPSTIMEKGQYVPTNALEAPSTEASSTNPCTLLSDTTLPFKPISLLGVTLGGTNLSAVQTFSFTIEYEYTVTFRGMRKPTIGYSGEAEPLDIVVQNSDIADSPLVYSDGPYSPVTIDLSEITTEPSYSITTLQRLVTENSPTTPLVEDAPVGTLWNRVELLVNVPSTPSSLLIDGFRPDPTSNTISLKSFRTWTLSFTLAYKQCIFFYYRSRYDNEGQSVYSFGLLQCLSSSGTLLSKSTANTLYYYTFIDDANDIDVWLTSGNNLILSVHGITYNGSSTSINDLAQQLEIVESSLNVN